MIDIAIKKLSRKYAHCPWLNLVRSVNVFKKILLVFMASLVVFASAPAGVYADKMDHSNTSEDELQRVATELIYGKWAEKSTGLVRLNCTASSIKIKRVFHEDPYLVSHISFYYNDLLYNSFIYLKDDVYEMDVFELKRGKIVNETVYLKVY